MQSLRKYTAAVAIATFATAISWQEPQAADELSVTATVTNPCSIGTGSIGFGTISSDSTPGSATGTLTLTNCNGFDTTVTIGPSNNGGTSEFALKGGPNDDLITYSLIESTFFGTFVAPGSSATIGVTSATLDLNFTADLDTADLANATAGAYSDAVDVTISFVPS